MPVCVPLKKKGMYFKKVLKVKTQLALFYWFAFFCISFTIENRKFIGSCYYAIAMAWMNPKRYSFAILLPFPAKNRGTFSKSSSSFRISVQMWMSHFYKVDLRLDHVISISLFMLLITTSRSIYAWNNYFQKYLTPKYIVDS